MTRAIGLALLVAISVALTIVVRAPAAWVGDWLEARSKVRLIDARGTVWAGSALVGFSDGRETTVVPGRVEWQVAALSPIRVSLAHPWLAGPLQLSLGGEAIGFARGAARVPAGVLASTGAPFNTIKPGGVLELAWTQGEIRGTALTGELQIDWRDAQSALSTVVPLGSYRLRITGAGKPPALELVTLRGPLEMQGTGTMSGSRIRFSGVAGAEPAMRPALNGLLGVLGMRAGDKVLLAIDT
jgi:general secretion pathway protein N